MTWGESEEEQEQKAKESPPGHQTNTSAGVEISHRIFKLDGERTGRIQWA